MIETLLNGLRHLDRRLLISGLLALIASLVLLLLVTFGPIEARFGSAIGLVALLVVIQVVLLFFRPADRSPFGLAREAFMAGDYPAAVSQLEKLTASKPNARGLTLLGNTYRHMGRLNEAEDAIEQALALKPNNAYALYGMGRVALARGAYETASEWFDRALARGAPANVGCDLGLAEYLAGNREAAIRTLQKTTRLLRLEPYRMYMTNLILWIIITDKTSTAAATVRTNLAATQAEGLPYWVAEAQRHSDTDYSVQVNMLIDAAPKGE